MSKLSFSKNNAVKIEVLSIKQNIGTFYIGKACASDVIQICSAYPREKRKDELEEYMGIERPLNTRRVEEIKHYIKTWDATFPNSIILALNKDHYFFENNILYIKKSKDSANIIDGQHRLAGFDKTNGRNFEIIISLFPELILEEQAYIFSVINTKMVKISPSLAQDLYALATINTPHKLAHNIARTFNKDKENPWFGKIKILGRKESGDEDSVISQSTLTKGIIDLICDIKDAYEIRDILYRNKNDRSSLRNFYDPEKAQKYVLWNAFVNGEDKFILTILKDYFSAVKDLYPHEWEDKSKILTKTTGYGALMKVFEKLVIKGFEEKDLTKEFFFKYLKKAKDSGSVKDFTSQKYNPGGMGETSLSNDILKGMKYDEK